MINLFILDISQAGSTSGVDRHIEKLLEGLERYSYIKIFWIHFTQDSNLLLHKKEEEKHYIKIILPFPQVSYHIIDENFWMKKYNQHVFNIIKIYFHKKDNCILHLHTLNLIDLALLIKKHYKCKIITHLHCIPWKGLYDIDARKFNYLYNIENTVPYNKINKKLFLTNNSELISYTESDHIVCGTQCGTNFLINIMRISKNKISIIHNGTCDSNPNPTLRKVNPNVSKIECLFVANLSTSKGIFFILESLRIVKNKGYNNIYLNVAGRTTPYIIQKIQKDYKDLNVKILGVQSYGNLIRLYKESDIGIISSLQEQWSFVGVEMAMFGLPIICTDIDGLDEMFTDNIDALKVKTKFSKVLGLKVDVVMMANRIIQLIESSKQRLFLSYNTRRLFERKFRAETMVNKTVKIYKQLTI